MRNILAFLGTGIALLAVGCNPGPAPGIDRASGSQTTVTSWTDGKQAYTITCSTPDGCQERALQLCNGNYTTLHSENMPMPGTVRSVLGQPSVVVRCG